VAPCLVSWGNGCVNRPRGMIGLPLAWTRHSQSPCNTPEPAGILSYPNIPLGTLARLQTWTWCESASANSKRFPPHERKEAQCLSVMLRSIPLRVLQLCALVPHPLRIWSKQGAMGPKDLRRLTDGLPPRQAEAE
jgi:hypothetical protein